MRDKKEIERLAYGVWLALTDSRANPLTVMSAAPLLGVLVWILGYESPDNERIDACLTASDKAIDEDCVEDPMARIVADLKLRREARDKAKASVNN